MKITLHTSPSTVAIGTDFVAWDVPGRVILTDPWRLREARQVLCRELVALDRAFAPRSRVVRRLRGEGARIVAPTITRPFPYGVTTAPANAVVHHRVCPVERLDAGRGRRGPHRLDPTPTVAATAVQRCAEAIAETTRCGVLVALGGDLATSGLAPAGGWRIALPAAPETVPTVLAVDGGALAVLGLPVGGPLRRLVVDATARPAPPVWRHLVVLGATAPTASAAVSGALLRGTTAPEWLAAGGLGARLVDAQGRPREVGRWPNPVSQPLVPRPERFGA